MPTIARTGLLNGLVSSDLACPGGRAWSRHRTACHRALEGRHLLIAGFRKMALRTRYSFLTVPEVDRLYRSTAITAALQLVPMWGHGKRRRSASTLTPTAPESKVRQGLAKSTPGTAKQLGKESGAQPGIALLDFTDIRIRGMEGHDCHPAAVASTPGHSP